MGKTESRETQRERRAHWRGLVEEACQSGQAPRPFCQERGLDLARFYYWRRALALEAEAEPGEARFALVRRGGARGAAGGAADLELQVGRGWRLKIPRGADPATLGRVLAALAAQS